MHRALVVISILLLLVLAATAQDVPAKNTDRAAAAAKPVLSPTVRLQAAKTAYVKNMDGSSIGADTITTTLEGWGRYRVVDSPAKADLLIEVTSPDDFDGGVSISSSSSTTGSGK